MLGMTRQIALIHATREAIAPVETAFRELWPEADHWTLLDESLTADLAAAGGKLTPGLTERFLNLAAYAAARGPDGILFTCSAFGAIIDRIAAEYRMPVMKPNEAVLDAALAQGGRVGILATHPQTLPDMTAEMEVSSRFLRRMFFVFLRRTLPASSMPKPHCMKKTVTPAQISLVGGRVVSAVRRARARSSGRARTRRCWHRRPRGRSPSPRRRRCP